MKLDVILPVILGVIKNPYVIGAAVFVLLYCNFISFVHRYTPKPPKPKKKVVAAPAPAAPAEEAQEADSEEAEE